MMKLKMILLVLCVGTLASAQEAAVNSNRESDESEVIVQDIDEAYAEPIQQKNVEVKTVAPSKGRSANLNRSQDRSSGSSQNQIYILNSNDSDQKQKSELRNRSEIQAQQDVQVEASPVVESRAGVLRKSRENIEIQTENKIVEKLEESRIDDERDRSDRLFGDRFNKTTYDPYQYPSRPVAPPPQPVAVVSPAPTFVPAVNQTVNVNTETKSNKKKVTEDEDEIEKVEIRTLKPESAAKGIDRVYLTADVGTTQYPDAKNVKGNAAAGVGVGVDLPSRFSFEGRFKYATYDLEALSKTNNQAFQPPVIKNVNQYNVYASTKYRFLQSTFSPTVGGILSYAYRSYDDKADASYSASSNAFDIGFSLGADLRLNDSFSVGVDYSYFSNLSYNQKTSAPTSQGASQIQSPLEAFNYYFLALSGKFYF